jgi:hypothetical protein
MIPVANTSTREIVSVMDTAIDKGLSDTAKYQETRDLSWLKYHDGQEPTVFVIAPIKRRDYNHYYGQIMTGLDKGISEEKLNKILELFARYVVDIKGVSFEIKKIKERGIEMLAPETIENIPGGIITEIGFSILNDVKLTDDETKK